MDQQALQNQHLKKSGDWQTRSLLVGGIGLAVIVAGVAWWAWQRNFFAAQPSAVTLTSSMAEATPEPTEVTLKPEKLDAAGIVVQEVQLQSVRVTKTVAGTIEYDPARHLEVTTPVDCLVAEVLVKPGATIAAGDKIAILASEQVGIVRDEIRRREADVNLKQRAYAYADEIQQNVEALLPLLESTKTDRSALEKLFVGKRLGEHREHLFVAYAKLATAQQVWNETEALANSGTLAGRTAQQRQSELEIARIAAVTQQETTLFESQQARDLAAADLEQAKRQLQIEQSRLRSLLGSLKIARDEEEPAVGEDLSRLIVLAPQAGRLEEHMVVKHQRLKAGDRILAIGDSSHLWLSAAIHERDWPATLLQPGEELRFHLPALSEQSFTATVRFVGTQVSAATHSLPLVADVDNAQGLLRPGMFAWVELPLEAARETLAVPAAAVTYHENQPFVFCELEPGHYRRQNVEIKNPGEETVEIVAGVKSGERIVVSGAFLLKSELLLEREE